MKRKINFTFDRIPQETTFVLIDSSTTKTIIDWIIPPGNSAKEITLSKDVSNLSMRLHSTRYFIPPGINYRDIKPSETIINITGADYYLDMTEETNQVRNQESVESLIYSISEAQKIDGRQKFYISLATLQTYFEHLVYGMLVMSGHMSVGGFDRLRTTENKIDKAFNTVNYNFFHSPVIICPGKQNMHGLIYDERMKDIKNIFHTIRKMRNDVLHSWGVKDITRKDFQTRFGECDEVLDIVGNDDEFYLKCVNLLVRIYSRVSTIIGSQLKIINEKYLIDREQDSRGYY